VITVHLNRATWQFDESEPLGPAGGFGEVFKGHAEDGSEVAMKRLHVDAEEASNRDLRIAEDLAREAYDHFLPVLDSGQDANSDRYYLVMLIAEESLQARLDNMGKLDEPESVDVLLQIARGLREGEHIVHRDLKPGDVLFHSGVWKIADYGIARFVSEETSVNTLKDCLSPHYAAPEQPRSFNPSNCTRPSASRAADELHAVRLPGEL